MNGSRNQTNLKLQDRFEQAQYFVAEKARWWRRALSAVEKLSARCQARDVRRALRRDKRVSSLCFAPCSLSTTMSAAVGSRAPSTPVRAIPSTLLSRTAPTIPPASQLYEPLVKGVLRHRLYKTFLNAAVLSWALVLSWRSWFAGAGDTLLMPIRPSILAYTVMTFSAGALPVLVLRKVHLVGEYYHPRQ